MDNLRQKISLKISFSDFLFSFENESIEEQNERNFTVDNIANENAVKLVCKNLKINYAIPIPGSIEKSKIDDKIIYSYPEYKLTEIEKADETNTKNILLIGQSGDGKTTFLNSLINVLANIKGEDKIRYKLVFENSEKKQNESQTDKITIYNVKINKILFRLIDSPGFIETKEKEKDEQYIKDFKDFFENEISYLNCICFIIKFSGYRLNETQKALYDKVSSIFSEEIKNNFIFIFTHYTSSGDTDAKVSLESNEVFKDIINADNIFKLDSAWAFSGDKEIKNYMWEKTFREIERIINEKFIKLAPVKTAQSAEIIEKRKEYHELFNAKMIEFKNKVKEIKNLFEKQKQKELNKGKGITLSYPKIIVNPSEIINTNCRNCKKTCHIHCECNLFLDIRYFCTIFGKLGFCKNCKCYFTRHIRENSIIIQTEQIINFKDDDEEKEFIDNEIEKIEKTFEQNILDINNNDIDILKDNELDLKKSFSNIYGTTSMEENSSYEKLIHYKKIEAIRIVLLIHNYLEDLNKLALNKNISKNIENFFDEIEQLDDFKDNKDIIKKIKKVYLKVNKGSEKNNNKFLIIKDEDIEVSRYNTLIHSYTGPLSYS